MSLVSDPADYSTYHQNIAKISESWYNGHIASLAEVWVWLGEELEMKGFAREKISSKIKKDIDSYLQRKYGAEISFHSGYFYRIMKERGWTRPYTDSSQQQQQSPLRGEIINSDSESEFNSDNDETITTMSSKSNLDSAASSAASLEVSSPYFQLRSQYIGFCNDIKKFADRIRKELEIDFDIEYTEFGLEVKKQRDWSKLFECEEDKLEYFAILQDTFYRMEETWRKSLDERQSILPYMFLPILAKTAITTIKHFSAKQFVHIRDIADITTKKTTQFLKSDESASAYLNSIKDESWKWHYADIKCPTCNEYLLQTKLSLDGTWKFVCKNWEMHNEEVFWPPERFVHKINAVSMNRGNAAVTFLKQRGVK